MSLAFPLPWAEFGKLLPIQSAAWRLMRFEEVTRTADGAALARELADPRWTVKVDLAFSQLVEAEPLRALIEMHGSSRPFLLHDPKHMDPAYDPGGAILGAAAVTVRAVNVDSLQLQALPAGYKLGRGDLVTVVHASGRSLHRVIEPVTANATGQTDWFQVDPTPRAAAAVGQQVLLKPATARMLIRPGSWRPGTHEGGIVRGWGFEAMEG